MKDNRQHYDEHKRAFFNSVADVLKDAYSSFKPIFVPDLGYRKSIADSLAACGSVRLFKYQPFTERNVADILHSRLHLSRVSGLNDINEGMPALDIDKIMEQIVPPDSEEQREKSLDEFFRLLPEGIATEETIAQFKDVLSGMSPDSYKQAAPMIVELGQAGMQLLRDHHLCGSLSETEFSASMWDRYAEGHRGFVTSYLFENFEIQLSASRDKRCTFDRKGLLCPVLYGDKKPDLTGMFPVLLSGGMWKGQPTEAGFAYMIMSVCGKSLEWEHELEWRIVSRVCRNNPKVTYAVARPDRIYLGLKTGQDESTRLIEVAERIGADVYRTVQDPCCTDYSLKAEKLPCGDGIE